MVYFIVLYSLVGWELEKSLQFCSGQEDKCKGKKIGYFDSCKVSSMVYGIPRYYDNELKFPEKKMHQYIYKEEKWFCCFAENRHE